MNSISTLKVHDAETRSLIEKIKAEIKKRAEAKARRRLLKAPKRQQRRPPCHQCCTFETDRRKKC